MILDNRYTIMMSVGLALALLGGCGSGASDTKAADNSGVVADDNNNTPNNENNNTDPVVVGYVAGNGVLFEGTQLVWVNTGSDEFCKISRPEDPDRDGKSVYQVAKEHCQKLANQNYGNSNNWRLPTVNEAKSLMNRNNLNFLIFPNSNKKCQYMTTDIENTFVFTTSSNNSDENVGTSFVDPARNNKTAGIRCVANQ